MICPQCRCDVAPIPKGEIYYCPQCKTNISKLIWEGMPENQSWRTEDKINPSHYLSHPSGVECITITEHMNFNLGNVMKYIWRCEGKGGLEDLKKARWYLEREINRLSKGEEPKKP